MSDRLPPLTALRAFEVAARRMSFAKAAEELGVTPAALSYQIKQLEEHLGVSLFHRLNRAVTLTEAGRALRPGVAEGFDALREAVRALDGIREGRALTITAGPAFTAKWLAPRLFHFLERHPDVEVRIVAVLRVLDFDRDDVDAAIRFGVKHDPGLFAETLIRDRLTPLCSPAFAARLTSPEALRDAPLIHDDSMAPLGWSPTWGDWLEAAGVERPDWRRGPRFSNADHALSAAAEGAAVALGRVSLAEPELRQGRLVAPFRLAIDPEAHFRFICPVGAESRPPLSALRTWLKEEIAASPDPLPRLKVVKVPRIVAAAQG
ncbi:MAG: transcriptional regulator GcvA [Rhodobacteraceae bacterium]|nr:MAG: transcriptional regulator GcvA [Paracoccaceae bacterium]